MMRLLMVLNAQAWHNRLQGLCTAELMFCMLQMVEVTVHQALGLMGDC